MTTSERTALTLVNEAWRAIEAGEIDRLTDVMSPEIELETTTGGGTGVEYAKGVFRRHVDSYPDIRHEVLGVVESADGQAVALEMRFTGTHGGTLRTPLGVIEPTGRRLTWRSSDHIRAGAGRIVSWRAYFDRLALLEQLGRMDLLAAGR
jgi:ketosteroid isomerase-like protein